MIFKLSGRMSLWKFEQTFSGPQRLIKSNFITMREKYALIKSIFNIFNEELYLNRLGRFQ